MTPTRPLTFFERFVYLSPQAAVTQGFTHHASYYGLPVYMGDVDDEAPLVTTPTAVLDFLLPVISFLEITFSALAGRDMPGFLFKIKAPLTPNAGGSDAS